MRNVKVLSCSLTLLLMSALFFSSCDDSSLSKDNITNSSVLSSVTGNGLHDTLIATSLGSLIDEGVTIDSIVFIGIDQAGLLGVKIKDTNGDEHTAVSVVTSSLSEDMQTARALCTCPEGSLQSPGPMGCQVDDNDSYWSCVGISCCTFTNSVETQLTVSIGLIALNTMQFVPSVTVL